MKDSYFTLLKINLRSFFQQNKTRKKSLPKYTKPPKTNINPNALLFFYRQKWNIFMAAKDFDNNESL